MVLPHQRGIFSGVFWRRGGCVGERIESRGRWRVGECLEFRKARAENARKEIGRKAFLTARLKPRPSGSMARTRLVLLTLVSMGFFAALRMTELARMRIGAGGGARTASEVRRDSRDLVERAARGISFVGAEAPTPGTAAAQATANGPAEAGRYRWRGWIGGALDLGWESQRYETIMARVARVERVAGVADWVRSRRGEGRR
jgi:hypothetical protein